MEVTHKVEIDVVRSIGKYIPPIDVMQADEYSRKIAFTVKSDGTALALAGNTAIIRFSKPDGTGGSYDTLPDGNTAYSIDGNVITITLAPQVCTVPGNVHLSVAIKSGSTVLHTFSITLNVHKTPGFQTISENYVGIAGVVAYDEQDLTSDQQAQARANIGAASENDLHLLNDTVRDVEGVISAEKAKVAALQAAVSGVDLELDSVVKFSEDQSLSSQEKETARNNIGAVSASEHAALKETAQTTAQDLDRVAAVVENAVLTTGQELTDEQKTQARANIGAVGTSEHTDLLGIVQSLEDNLRLTDENAIKQNTEAPVASIKILHSQELSDAIFVEGSTVSDKDSLEVNALTLRGDFDGSIDDDSVILRNVHAGESPTDAVNLGQLDERAPVKVYEHIATITVAPDTDGSLPQYVTFSADSEGNAFQLTDFFVRAYAGFADGNQSTLYVSANGNLVIANSAIASISSSCRYFNVFLRQEDDGFKRVEHTSSSLSTNSYDPQSGVVTTRMIPPMSTVADAPINKIELYTATGTTKAWVEGSTFELWGVRV